MSSTLSEKQAQINLHLREKYMEEIRLRRQERERKRQENMENGIVEHPKRVDSAGSDDGVHSSGEKAEDDINDDDLLGAALHHKDTGTDVDDDEDEGMGSMVGAGEKIKDDPDDASRPESANTEGKAAEALTDDAESAQSLVENNDEGSAGSVSGYHADAEDDQEEHAVEDPEPEAESAEPEGESAEPEAESAEPEAESAELEAESAEPETESAEPETESAEPEAESADPESETAEPEAESAEPEAESAEPETESAEPETESAEPEAETAEPDAESAEPEAESAEPETEPANEPEAESAEPEAVETEALTEEPENTAVIAEEENPATETSNPTEAEPENGGIPEIVPDKPPDTSRRRKKKKIYFDMEKVTANRKPLSIRTTPLAIPVSSKKENENFKPHLKNRYELIQKQNKLKWKAKMQTKPLNQSTPSVLIAPTPTVEVTVSPATEELQGQLEGIISQVGGDKMKKESFVNPLMDPSMERPVAPHKRKRSDSIPGTKMAVGSGVAVDPKSEVWVPGEDNLYVYSYSSLPRLLHIKRLGGKRVATTFSNDTDPNSSFRLKNRSGRVIRGTNFGKDGAPKWNPYFAYARCLSANDYAFYETEEMRQRREEFRERMKVKAKERKEHLGLSNIFRTTNGPTNHNHQPFTSVRRSTFYPRYSYTKNSMPRTYPHFDHTLHADRNFPFGNYTSRFDRRARPPCISIGIQVFEEELSQLDSSVSAEVAVIKALVSNILREAAVEVAAEAEADGVKMEQLAARRLSADGAKNETTDEEIRKDPEGEEAPPETTEEEIAPDPPEEEPAPADEEKEEADIDLPEPDEVIGKGEDLTEPEEVPAG